MLARECRLFRRKLEIAGGAPQTPCPRAFAGRLNATPTALFSFYGAASASSPVIAAEDSCFCRPSSIHADGC